MQPQIALLVYSLFIFGILIVDSRRKSNISVALWIPLIWLAMLASRPVVNLFYPSQGLAPNNEAGNPFDRNILLVLMFIATLILFKRKLLWTQWLRENPWFFLFFLYCGISIVWSDFPGISLKRWFRAIGSLMMILVVLSEADPIVAVRTVIRRCTYVLVPLSILLNKYYREMAVSYGEWSGTESLAGITTDKNGLGRLCLVGGLFLLWDIITVRHNNDLYNHKLNRSVTIILFLMTIWLLVKSNSATALGSFVIGSCILIGLGLPIIRTKVRHIGTLLVLTALIFLILDLSFNLTEVIVTELLGRNMTFTERTYIWADLLDMGTNPIFGVGYDSFWLGERFDFFMQKHHVSQAHNGYLEVYVEVGMIGLFLFAGFLFATFRKAKSSLLLNFDYGRVRMALLFIFLFYNITEPAYKATTFLFVVFLLVAIDIPRNVQSQIPVDAMAKSASRNNLYNLG